MIASRLCFVMIALAAGTAHAQPGADGPPPPPPPPPDAPPPPGPGADVRVDAQAQLDPGAAIDRLAANAPLIERIAKGTFKRARRAISIGPTVGVYGGMFPDAEETDFAITFGVGIEVFKVPILPGPEVLKEIAIKRAKEKLRKLDPAGLDPNRLAQEIWDDAVKEVLGMENIRAKTMEKPRFTVALEANRLLDSEVWMARFRAGLGISKITLAGSTAIAFTDPKTSVYTGLELVAHFLMSKQPRASVVDVFFRADFEVRNRDLANADFYVLGVRYLLDAL